MRTSPCWRISRVDRTKLVESAFAGAFKLRGFRKRGRNWFRTHRPPSSAPKIAPETCQKLESMIHQMHHQGKTAGQGCFLHRHPRTEHHATPPEESPFKANRPAKFRGTTRRSGCRSGRMRGRRIDSSDEIRRLQRDIISIIGIQSTGVEVAAGTPVHQRIWRFRRTSRLLSNADVLASWRELALGSLRLSVSCI